MANMEKGFRVYYDEQGDMVLEASCDDPEYGYAMKMTVKLKDVHPSRMNFKGFCGFWDSGMTFKDFMASPYKPE